MQTAGLDRIAWAAGQMPVLVGLGERFAASRPLAGSRVIACLHVTAETANLMAVLRAGGAEVSLCAANPLATQDEVAIALRETHGVEVRARRSDDFARWETEIAELARTAANHDEPWVVIDDGAELLTAAHSSGPEGTRGLIGGTEETTTGLARLRALEAAGELRCPVLAVNEAQCEHQVGDRHGTGQSTIDGIVRATNVLLAGQTLVLLGYGWAGQGVAERARGAGAAVVVCEIDPLRALAARMAGYEVMPIEQAVERGDIFITVTGREHVLRREHFERMKDGAVLANAGRFDVEIDLDGLRAVASGPRLVRELIECFQLPDGRRLNLLARGQVVNLAAAEGHPAAVMDISFALQALSVESLVRERRSTPGVVAVPDELDREVARLKLASLGVEIDS